jgi:PAT family beta-lactamase induction signal transducer AmpG
MYKNLNLSNTEIALYTSWLYLPWVIKPLWAPLVDLLGTKRGWIVAMQFLVGAAFALVALTLPAADFFRWSLAVFWLMAFSSATHDIAADGFYLLAMQRHQQAAFVGVRSTFYRLAMIAGQGGLVFLAGRLQTVLGDVARAWSWVFIGLAGGFVVLASLHAFVLPRPEADRRAPAAARHLVRDFLAVFAAFFRKPEIGVTLAFLLLYRLGEAQLLKLVTPFLLDARDRGGLGLSTEAVGIVYGTIGVIALTCGGLLGGWMISRHGLRRMLWPMLLATLGDRGGGVGDRAVWLRLRVHRVHGLHDARRGGAASDRALCALHRLHGLGDDAPWNGRRMDRGPDRLPRVLHLGLPRDAAIVCGRGATQD